MYAVIQHGGKQYKVSTGEEVRVDLMDAEEGQLIEFDRVLLVGGVGHPRIGRPTIEGARVLAEVVRHELGPKITLMRMHPTEMKQAKRGHRQRYTRVIIREIHPE